LVGTTTIHNTLQVAASAGASQVRDALAAKADLGVRLVPALISISSSPSTVRDDDACPEAAWTMDTDAS